LSKRARAIGWTLIILFPILVLAGIEGSVRAFGISPSFERDAAIPPWLDRNILVKDARWIGLLSSAPGELKNYYATYEWDRYLFYRLRPNLSIPLTDLQTPPGIRERTRWRLRTNASGYPGHDAAKGPHAGVYRILSAGDSSTFGWGVESEEAYPAVLETQLRRRHPGMGIEVVNLGVCGYSSLQGRVLLEREGLAYAPDLVTISYGSNDWSKVPEPFDEVLRRNEGWLGGVRAALHHSRAYQIYAAFLAKAARGGGAPANGGSGPAPGGGGQGLVMNVGPERSERNLVAMIEDSRRGGADAILVTNCVPGPMADPLRAAARATGAPLLDTEDLLRGAIASRDTLPGDLRARVRSLYGAQALEEHPDLEVYLSDRCHPNVIGQRLVAEALAGMVESAPSFRRAAGGRP
jgi:lysophospholipase L1-like esterase